VAIGEDTMDMRRGKVADSLAEAEVEMLYFNGSPVYVWRLTSSKLRPMLEKEIPALFSIQEHVLDL